MLRTSDQMNVAGEAMIPKPGIREQMTPDGTGALLVFGIAVALLHILASGQYGFHRDELLTFDNARHLAWGYAVYPPVTAFVGRIELELFGTSLTGFRLVPALAMGCVVVLAGLMARELGGKREAQVVAAAATAIAGPCLWAGDCLSYTTFDYFWWVAAAYLLMRLLRTGDARWWVAIGGAVGMGMLSKYTMGFFALGMLGGMVFTPARRYARSVWFWCGIGLCVLLMAPNIVWQAEHGFVSLEYMKAIHTRDMGQGSTDNFLLNQLYKSTNPVTVPLWMAGLWFVFTGEGKRFRMLGWMYTIPLVVLFAMRGRDYYLAPAYPMLLAAGAVWGEGWLATLSQRRARIVRRVAWRNVVIGGVVCAAVVLPVAPLGTKWWRIADAVNGNFNMEVGWPELAATVAKIRSGLSPSDRARLGILAGDEGETGAINMYGPALGLPTAISGMNSNWDRGWRSSRDDPPPETLITLGLTREELDPIFASCRVAGRVDRPYGIENLTMKGHEEIFVCRDMRKPWPEFWKDFRYCG